MSKTKIVCTIGPACDSISMLKQLLAAGMDVARLNMAHGSNEEHGKRIRDLRQASSEAGQLIPIMMDIKGPEVRVGMIHNGSMSLLEGTHVILSADIEESDAEHIPVTYRELSQDLKPDDCILIDDGLLELRVESIQGSAIHCLVVTGGILKSKKNLNIPGVIVNLPNVTEKDREHIRFGIEAGIDMIAASFVRSANAVLEIRELLEQLGAPHIQIISKIENHEGIENIREIIEVSDGVMVARGDLGVQLPAEEIPIVQKEIIRLCNAVGKPVITATQMMDSMQWNPRPTRAEASDVANAIWDGTDAVMLSGESAAGKYPVESVQTMARIAARAESVEVPGRVRETWGGGQGSGGVTAAVGASVAQIADELGAAVIVTYTQSGYAARMVARERPHAPILAVTPSEHVAHCLRLVGGVIPIHGEPVYSTDQLFEVSLDRARQMSSLVEEGDLIVLTAGVPVGGSGATNLIRVHKIGE